MVLYIHPAIQPAMHAEQDWQDDTSTEPALQPRTCVPAGRMPAEIEAALWRGTELGTPVTAVVKTGWEALDERLPGGGWPCHSLTEVLQLQPSLCEWRLTGPALRSVVAAGHTVVVVGPPKHPHLPGLRHEGIDDRHFVWLQADTPAERLWATEQLVKSNACGALLSWLPHARPEQLRRLQVCAAACDGPVIVFRPEAARHEASPAPLRLLATYAFDWELHVHLLKRKGARHDGVIRLPSVPGGLQDVLTPRMRSPSRWISRREVPADVLGSPAPRQAARRRVAA
jgi:protein ImuA